MGTKGRLGRQIASVGSVIALSIGFVTVAVANEGFPVTEVDLNDSGVWVANVAARYVGRFNFSASQLDGASYVDQIAHFDIIQENAAVLVQNTDDGSIVQVNPAQLSLGRSIGLGTGSQVNIGKGQVGLFVPSVGKFWTLPVSSIASFDVDSEAFPPLLEDLPANAVTTMDVAGTAFVVDPLESRLTTIKSGEAPTQSDLDNLDPEGSYALTAVGDTPVLYSRGDHRLFLGAKKSVDVAVDDEASGTLTLQQVSAAETSVVYTTNVAQVTQPLDGGDPATVDITSQGAGPTPSVIVGGCSYSVWSYSGDFVRDCVGDDLDAKEQIENVSSSDQMRLRTNRGHVVLNGSESGGVWMVTDRIEKVDNWDEVMAGDKGEQEQEAKEELDENTQPEHTDENHPPAAVDDTFGVRPGRSTLLPVLENDQDEDGDPLTASIDGDGPNGVTVGLVYNNSVFQIDVPATATGSFSFRYKASDGRGGESSATVRINVRTDGVNEAPAQVRPTSMVVTSGHKATYNVLTNWRDPDGDTLFLTDATTDAADSVQRMQDGSLTFIDGGTSTGAKTVTVTVSDGELSSTGEVNIMVYPSGNRKPTTTNDLVTVAKDSTVDIYPLQNDSDPDGDVLQLTEVADDSRCDLIKDQDVGKVTATCHEVGSVYLQYKISDGPSQNQIGWIRINVTDPTTGDEPPTAVPDTALLPSGEAVTVPVLDNDVNPLGYPLVITDVSTGDNAPVSVTVIDFAKVRITQLREFSTSLMINYTVSNGVGFASSTITVVPMEPPSTILPPQAQDDTVTVRVGDVATVNVLDNDTQANGIPLKLLPDLAESPDPDAQALTFVSGNSIRVHARQTPGTYYTLYQVAATQGTAEPDTGRLTIYVKANDDDPDHNQAPKPVEIQARTLAGRPVVIPVPLDEIDPDGDFVSLVGIGTAPTAGRITDVGSATITYDPGQSTSGKVTFTYQVKDRLGKGATGNVVLTVAPAKAENHPPLTMPDQLNTRPGKDIRSQVLNNDSDPDGDSISLVSAEASEDAFPVNVEDNQITFTSPAEVGDYWVMYVIEDEYGLQATGSLTVHVEEGLPPMKPRPFDDIVTPLEALSSPAVTVDVLKNDIDPDGDIRVDTLAVDHPEAVIADGVVTIPVAADLQIIDYSLTDPDGLVGHAFITVPGSSSIVPQLNPSATGLTVKAGETVSFALSDHVLVRPGKTPRATQAAKMTAWNGTVSADSVTQLSFSAPADYVGPASISVEVTDGQSVDDPEGLTAVITIPVTVTAADGSSNQPPKMMGSAMEIEVAGEAKLDLSPLVTDPDTQDEFTFAVVTPASTEGIKAALDGSQLSVSVSQTTTKGTTDKITVSVDDGHNTPVEAVIAVSVVASSRPLPHAVDDPVPDAHQGREECVSVTDNDSNPFPDTPLTIVTAVIESGVGTYAIGCGGKDNAVSVTPDSAFVGSMVVAYTISDATTDPDRYAQGRIRLNVKGKPSPPAGLHIDQVGNRQVILSWQPPNNNGDPITGYAVTASPAAGPWNCGTKTVCTLTGLTNNVTYTFTVTATNSVGTSDPSLPSAEARPDTIPNHASAPSLTFGDKLLQVVWTDPGSQGSPVTSYRLRISPPPSSGQSELEVPGTTSYTWTGLTNGTSYKVSICPVNLAEGVCKESTQWSDYSQPETPAAPPDAPAKPTVTRLDPIGGEAQAQICWTAPNMNGAPISTYTVTSSLGGSYPVTDGTTCKVVLLTTNQSDYTFQVAGTNKAGQGAFSAPSNAFRSFVPPGPVTSVVATDADNACGISFGPAALNGAKGSEVTYQWQSSNGKAGNFGTSTSGTATGQDNNQTNTIQVWARTTVQGVSYDGPKTPSNACVPFGKPFAPSADATKSGDRNSAAVTLSWKIPARNGRDFRVEVNIDNEGWKSVGTTAGSESRDHGWSANHSIAVRAVDAAAQTTTGTTATVTANSQPIPSYSVWLDSNDVRGASGEYSGGRRIHVDVSQLFRPGTYTLKCSFVQPNGKTGSSSKTITIGNDGVGAAFCADPNGYWNVGDRGTIEIVGIRTCSGVVNGGYGMDNWSCW